MDRLLISRFTLALGTAALLAATPSLAADAAHGKQAFQQKCMICHSAAKGGAAMVGPPLYGIVGRKAASVPGYNYSTAMRAVTYAWSDEKLTAYLAAPKKVVPGTKMAFVGLTDPGKLADLVAYLDTLK